MEEMKFKSLQRGDSVFTLERDRRSMYPIFDRAKVVKVGESKPRAYRNCSSRFHWYSNRIFTFGWE